MTGTNNNFVIFGGTGDLSYRKLLPALYNIFSLNNELINITIIGRRSYTLNEYIDIIKPWIKEFSRIEYSEELFNKFIKTINYYQMDFTNINEYEKLSKYFDNLSTKNNIYYLAVAPRFFDNISKGLSTFNNLSTSKIVIEKPFGETLKEAHELNNNLEKIFTKDNIYHIDHYLGKEMIQNLLTVRFNNPVFSDNWNKEHIECIQIIASESNGVGTRASYYDQSGALKDMMQNHLMQILSMVAMEEPTKDISIKQRQVEVLKHLRSVDKINIENHMLLGRYDTYLQEDNVPKTSTTETLAMCKLYIDNNRWDNVPFYIITGKKLKNRELIVVITFKSKEGIKPNVLTFKIHPLEAITLSFNVQKPGSDEETINTVMDFYKEELPTYGINTPEAYEHLILEILNEDHTWFASWDQIETSWIYIESLKEKYIKENLELISYNKDTIKFDNIDKLLDKEEHLWSSSSLECKLNIGSNNEIQ